jgi:ribosome recycling factor
MDVDGILRDCKQRMDRTLEHLQRELRGIRTGRATTALVDYIKAEYYGTATEIRELATVSVPEPTVLILKPFDPGSSGNIIRALETADLGLNPKAEGGQIRINIPPPSADRRKQLAGQVRKMAEDARVAVRNERRDALRHIEGLVKDKAAHLSEDRAKIAKEEVEKATKQHIEKVDQTSEKKVAEIIE